MIAFDDGSIPTPNHSLPSVTCSCSPPVMLTIIGVSVAKDSSVANPKPSASEMFTVQSTELYKTDNCSIESFVVDNLNWSWHDSSNNTQYESNLLKLNCEKAHIELKWKPSLTFKQTVQMTADWYSHFYKNKDKTIFDLTRDQVKFYQSILEKENLL